MAFKRALLRPLADTDLIEATQYYAREGGRKLGERVFSAALEALNRIEETPGIGSTRLGELCDITDLRAWPVEGFPLRWLYFETENHLDVVRLLGDRQDVLALQLTTD